MSRSDPERWRRIESICDAALQRDGAAREAYLDDACGDDNALRREVEALLAHDRAASEFLAAPVGAVAANIMSEPARDLIGRRLGDYDIVARLGEGGMGVVYRARDRKLGRDVAIKVLPPAVADDPERLKRFEREARLLATVNHPGIGAIYGFVEGDGVRALVLELIEGDTLAAALQRGPLKLARALAIGAQIADALDHAHRRGITHRDLKPSNVMLAGGTVKLLDFGVGKWTPTTAGGAMTGASTLTAEGVIVGTLHYMAPEQLEGRDADARSDIFAFGAVLYEMLTGRKAFDGPSQASIIAAVLESPTPRLSGVGGTQAHRLERIVNKSLAKSPDERWQSARDLADEFRWLADDLTRAASPDTSTPPQKRLPLAKVAAGASAAVAVALLAWGAATRWRPVDADADSPVIRFSLQPPPGREFDANFDISPNGRAIVFDTADPNTLGVADEARVYLRRLDTADAEPFPVIANLLRLAFSPDSQFVASVGPRGISTTPLTGGSPVTVFTESLVGPHAIAWGGPDEFFVASRSNPIQRVSARGGAPVAVTAVDATTDIDHHSPLLLPGGRHLLFAIHDRRNRFKVAAMSLGTGETASIIESGFDPRYSPTGHLVFGRSSHIMAAPFDASQARVTGPAVTMIERANTDARSGIGHFALSATGTLVYGAPIPRSGRQLVFVDRAGTESAIPVPAREFETPSVSPDGRQLAFAVQEDDRRDIWVYTLATERLARVTSEHDNWAPLWTRNGRALVYASDRGDVTMLMRQPLDGSAAQVIGSSINDVWPNAVAGDGETILVTEQPPTDDYRIAQLTTESGGRLAPLIEDRGLPRAARISPDGRWLAYAGQLSGRSQVYVRAYPDGPSRQLSVDGGRAPIWSRDGRELYFRSGSQMLAVGIDPGGDLSWGKPVLLFDRHYLTSMMDYDVAPDGRFVMIKPDPGEFAPMRLNVIVNWARELNERVPTRR